MSLAFYLRSVRLISGPIVASNKFASIKLWCLDLAPNRGQGILIFLLSSVMNLLISDSRLWTFDRMAGKECSVWVIDWLMCFSCL